MAHLGASAYAARLLLALSAALLGCTATSSIADAGGSLDASMHPDSSIDGGEPVAFSARLSGDLVIVDVPRDVEMWQWSCMGWTAGLVKPVDGTWVGLQDDRHPSARNPGYFLDGQYIPPSANLGCDFQVCEPVPFGAEMTVGFAREYVKTGTMAPPADAELPPPDLITPANPADVIETRAFHGELRVRFKYSTSSDCSEPLEVNVPLEVPEDGVCCPIGAEDCSSTGPGGGWAPTLDACREWSTVADQGYSSVLDVRGCPELIDDVDACCACQQDAGI